MIVTGAVAVWGVVMLSKDHPDAVAEREIAPPAAAEATWPQNAPSFETSRRRAAR